MARLQLHQRPGIEHAERGTLAVLVPLLMSFMPPANGSGSSADEWLLAGAIVLGGAVFFFSKGRNKK